MNKKQIGLCMAVIMIMAGGIILPFFLQQRRLGEKARVTIPENVQMETKQQYVHFDLLERYLKKAQIEEIKEEIPALDASAVISVRESMIQEDDGKVLIYLYANEESNPCLQLFINMEKKTHTLEKFNE